ncbi:MAG: 50S ribosomal protein L16 [Candidatus Kerfeldbacteria bacterium]|nr:50S ribosomal protein L16 [Candidatus Kerfeldbacteria bacterium]
MLTPKKVKHRKWHNQPIPKVPQVASRKISIAFGDFALKSTESSWITARQIEAARRAMTRFVQRGGKIWVRIFTQRPVTLKGGEIRMGGGKGAVDHYIAVVKPGAILFEIAGVTETDAREAFRLAAHKLPVKTKFVKK